jgi:hypothetical protein
MIFLANYYISSSIPIRNGAKVDPWFYRWFIPARYYYWPTVGLGRQQFNSQSE